MTDAIRPLIAGNWKMNGLRASTAEFDAMLAGAAAVAARADLLICPPATLCCSDGVEASTASTAATGARPVTEPLSRTCAASRAAAADV